MKTREELLTFPTFEERFLYLKLDGKVGDLTFNGNRYLNQMLYHSERWKKVRREIILLDEGFDLGVKDERYLIVSNRNILVHHIEPITVEDVLMEKAKVFDINNLISVSLKTHNAIHYSNECYLNEYCSYVERTKNDTIPWR